MPTKNIVRAWLNLDGTLRDFTKDKVFADSNNTVQVSIVAPFDPLHIVDLGFTLTNGNSTPRRTATLVGIGTVEVDGESELWNEWRFPLPSTFLDGTSIKRAAKNFVTAYVSEVSLNTEEFNYVGLFTSATQLNNFLDPTEQASGDYAAVGTDVNRKDNQAYVLTVGSPNVWTDSGQTIEEYETANDIVFTKDQKATAEFDFTVNRVNGSAEEQVDVTETDIINDRLATLETQTLQLDADKVSEDLTEYPTISEPLPEDYIYTVSQDGQVGSKVAVAKFGEAIALTPNNIFRYPTNIDSGLVDPATSFPWKYSAPNTGDANYSNTEFEVEYGDGTVTKEWAKAVGEWEEALYEVIDSDLIDGDFTDLPISFHTKTYKVGDAGAIRPNYYKVASDGSKTLIQSGPVVNIANDVAANSTKSAVIAGLVNFDRDAGEKLGIVYEVKRDTANSTKIIFAIMGVPVTTYNTLTLPTENLVAQKQDKPNLVTGTKVAKFNPVTNSSEESDIELDDVVQPSDLDDYQLLSEKNQAGGYIGFDEAEKLANKDQNGGYLGINGDGDVNVSRNLTVVGITASGNVEIIGNLIVRGTQTTVDSTEFVVADERVVFNKDQTGTPSSALLSGVEIERGDEDNYIFGFEELTQLFKIGKVGSLQAVATREDSPLDGGMMVYDDATKRLVSRAFLASTEITDMPSSLVGEGRKLLKVKSDETGYELVRENNNGSTGILEENKAYAIVNAGDPSLYDIVGGKVQFIDTSVDPARTVVVDIASQQGLTLTGIGTRNRSGLKFQIIDYALGTYQIVELPGPFTDQDYKNDIPFAILFHPNGTIENIGTVGWVAIQHSKNSMEMAGLYAPSLKNGNQYTPNGANLNVDVAAGQFRCLGCERLIDIDFPNITDSLSVQIEPFILVYRDGTGLDVTFDDNGGALYTAINPTWFDDGTGVIGTNPGNNTSAVVHRWYRSPRTKTTYLVLGQTSYATLTEAADAARNTDALADLPTYLDEELVFSTWMSVRKAATALNNPSDATFEYVGIGIAPVSGSVSQSLNDTQIVSTSSLGGLSSKNTQREVNDYFEYLQQGKTRVINPGVLNNAFSTTLGMSLALDDVVWVKFPTTADVNGATLSVDGGSFNYPILELDGTPILANELDGYILALQFNGTQWIDTLDIYNREIRLTAAEANIVDLDNRLIVLENQDFASIAQVNDNTTDLARIRNELRVATLITDDAEATFYKDYLNANADSNVQEELYVSLLGADVIIGQTVFTGLVDTTPLKAGMKISIGDNNNIEELTIVSVDSVSQITTTATVNAYATAQGAAIGRTLLKRASANPDKLIVVSQRSSGNTPQAIRYVPSVVIANKVSFLLDNIVVTNTNASNQSVRVGVANTTNDNVFISSVNVVSSESTAIQIDIGNGIVVRDKTKSYRVDMTDTLIELFEDGVSIETYVQSVDISTANNFKTSHGESQSVVGTMIISFDVSEIKIDEIHIDISTLTGVNNSVSTTTYQNNGGLVPPANFPNQVIRMFVETLKDIDLIVLENEITDTGLDSTVSLKASISTNDVENPQDMIEDVDVKEVDGTTIVQAFTYKGATPGDKVLITKTYQNVDIDQYIGGKVFKV